MTEDNLSNMQFLLGEFSSGKVYVPVEIDNKRVDFFIDTGATFTGIKDIGLLNDKSIAGDYVFQSASGIPLIAKQATSQKILLGNIERQNAKVNLLPDEFEHDTILGIDFFDDSYFSFCSENKAFKCDFNNLELSQDFLITEKGHIGINCILNDLSCLGIWDTGAELTVISTEFKEKYRHLLNNPKKINNGIDSTGAKIDFTLWSLTSLTIAGNAFSNIHVLEMDFDKLRRHFDKNVEIIIGFNLIIKANWEFNMKTKTFDVQLINL